MSRLAHSAAAALVAAAALAGFTAVPAGAAGSHVRTVCARQSRVVSTPGGLAVGFLARGAAVFVLARTHNGYWTEIRAAHAISGWIHTHDLC